MGVHANLYLFVDTGAFNVVFAVLFVYFIPDAIKATRLV